MENFSIRFDKVDEDGYYDFYGINGYDNSKNETEFSYCMNEVKKIKKVILEDFRRILENKICYLKDKDKLEEYIFCLLETYNNGVIDTFYGVNNFIVMTDNYLCFNNVINDVDDYLFGVFGKSAVSCEMIVIVDRKFMEYYFIMMDVSIFNGKTKTIINKFNICDDKVVFRSVLYDGYFSFKEYDELSIKKKIKSIKFK